MLVYLIKCYCTKILTQNLLYIFVFSFPQKLLKNKFIETLLSITALIVNMTVPNQLVRHMSALTSYSLLKGLKTYSTQKNLHFFYELCFSFGFNRKIKKVKIIYTKCYLFQNLLLFVLHFFKSYERGVTQSTGTKYVLEI